MKDLHSPMSKGDRLVICLLIVVSGLVLYLVYWLSMGITGTSPARVIRVTESHAPDRCGPTSIRICGGLLLR